MTSTGSGAASGGAPPTREPYRAPISVFWWLHKGSYTFFVLREITSVFVAWSVVFLLLFLRALAQGDTEYHAFVNWASSPWVILLNLVTFALLLLHSVTWFNLTPAAMAVRMRGRPVPPLAVAAGAYAGWVVVSVVVVWLVVTRQMAGRRRAGVEPYLWLLFSAGGVASAVMLPALVALLALAIPFGWITPDRDRLLGLLGNPLVALVLFGVCVLSLFHWAQRFRYTLFDGLKLKAHQRPINATVYLLAVLGSVAALVVCWQAVVAS